MIRAYQDYIVDVLDSIDKAQTFVKGMTFEAFEKDPKTSYAVVRAFEIMGEAVGKIPAGVRNRFPEIPWKEMAGMRNKLIHEYFGIQSRVVWKTIKHDLPKIKPHFQKILDDLTMNP
ncbi:MAG: DUF86 domain-containing protein [Candidatus Omnitrophica bacterium]|nr:DUF86 domain-containing protein [Candidatus Omnitrophota bacterium]